MRTGSRFTYQQYKKRTRVGTVDVPAGAVMLHQIVNSNQFSGAGGHVFEKFCPEIVQPLGGQLFLSVREENTTACQFYERHGMKVVGSVAWASGTIPGHIYFRDIGSSGDEWLTPEMAVKVGGRLVLPCRTMKPLVEYTTKAQGLKF